MSDRKLNDLTRMVELARGHAEKNEPGPAEVYYRMILKDTTPPKTGIERLANGEACAWFARRNYYQGNHGAALDWFTKAIQADPYAVDYRLEYCVKVLMPMGMFKYARVEAERATKIEPENKEAWRVLGGLEAVLMNVEASIHAYNKQLELDSDNPTARLDRATVALDTADYKTVREMCEPVLKTDRAADAYHTLAMAFYREGKHEEAIELYNKAIEGKCYDPELAIWNKSLALHSLGRYKEGWAAHEYRGKQKTDQAMALVMNRFQTPPWALEPPPARLHIHQEMGHGDVIAMARYIPLLQKQGYQITFEVNESMVTLMQRSLPGVQVIPRAIDYPGAMGIPRFDYHVPSLSLPYLFGTDIETVPWEGPYLTPDPDLAYQYALQMRACTGKKVGLVWSSGIREEGLWLSQYGKRKSMHFITLRDLVRVGYEKPIQFVSLQVGPERKEHDHEIVDILPQKPNWDHTAALVANLDLVITVDTSVAHLAGAMGKPTIVMIQQDGASWHFMCERPGAPWNDKSPWYPNTKLIRQTKPGNWTDVVARVKQELVA